MKSRCATTLDSTGLRGIMVERVERALAMATSTNHETRIGKSVRHAAQSVGEQVHGRFGHTIVLLGVRDCHSAMPKSLKLIDWSMRMITKTQLLFFFDILTIYFYDILNSTCEKIGQSVQPAHHQPF